MNIKFFSIFVLVLLVLNLSFVISKQSVSVGVEVIAKEEVSIADVGRDLAESIGNLMSFRGDSSIFLLPIITVVLILILLIIILFKKKKKKFKKKKSKKKSKKRKKRIK